MDLNTILEIFSNNFCSISDVPSSQSFFGQFWKGVTSAPPEMLWFVVLVLLFWVIKELVMRNKNKYNSANGFTPDFNKMVGSLNYVILQVLTYFLLSFVFGNAIYCMPWPYVAHAIVFSLNWTILNAVGFWPDKPKIKKKKFYKRKK